MSPTENTPARGIESLPGFAEGFRRGFDMGSMRALMYVRRALLGKGWAIEDTEAFVEWLAVEVQQGNAA